MHLSSNRRADRRSRAAKLTRQAAEFRLRNAVAWANSAAGEDVAGQVGPQALLAAGGDPVAGDVLD